jgi:IS5 family transposase
MRCQLSNQRSSKIKEFQKVLADFWKPYIRHSNILSPDTTYYETSVRYYANIKLLWESVELCNNQMVSMCKFLKVRIPSNKYMEQRNKSMYYSRKRKKTWKETHVRIRSLLHQPNAS